MLHQSQRSTMHTNEEGQIGAQPPPDRRAARAGRAAPAAAGQTSGQPSPPARQGGSWRARTRRARRAHDARRARPAWTLAGAKRRRLHVRRRRFLEQATIAAPTRSSSPSRAPRRGGCAWLYRCAEIDEATTGGERHRAARARAAAAALRGGGARRRDDRRPGANAAPPRAHRPLIPSSRPWPHVAATPAPRPPAQPICAGSHRHPRNQSSRAAVLPCCCAAVCADAQRTGGSQRRSVGQRGGRLAAAARRREARRAGRGGAGGIPSVVGLAARGGAPAHRAERGGSEGEARAARGEAADQARGGGLGEAALNAELGDRAPPPPWRAATPHRPFCG